METLNRRHFAVIVGVSLLLCHQVSTAQAVEGPGEWIEINDDASWEARAGLQVVYLNNAFYLMGGRTPRPPSDPVIPGDSEIWNDVWRSDDLGETWTKILNEDSDPLHWPARAYFQALTMNDRMYVLGGQNFITVPNPDCAPPFLNCPPFISTSDFFNDVWSSEDGQIWESMTDSAGWSGRAGFSAVVFQNELYVMGGSINDDVSLVGGPPNRIYLNDVWKSPDGINWIQLTPAAEWSERAGGIAVVKDGFIYMIGGEEGFLCLPGTPCPPYFNDVWRSADGIIWEEVTPAAQWKKRPGHQVVVMEDQFVLFGGFGLSEDIFDPFAVANPRDVWISEDGADWERISRRPWNALSQAEIKYDFDALSIVDPYTRQQTAYTFGGDRETFDFTDPLNYLNVDNDVWKYCLNECSVISSAFDSKEDQLITGNPYPIPARQVLNVDLTIRSNLGYTLEIIDHLGRVMSAHENIGQRQNEEIQIDVSDYPSGVYRIFIQVQEKRITRSFVVN